MNTAIFTPKHIAEPQILETAHDYILLYKPPQMHSAPGKGENIADWCAQKFPETKSIKGRKEGEGGLLHRLDCDTRGLLLFARNQDAFDALLADQEKNLFVKEYAAFSEQNDAALPGFPPCDFSGREQAPFIIKSFFRAYGPGRKQVRPVLEGGGKKKGAAQGNSVPYRTEIYGKDAVAAPCGKECCAFNIRLCKGFRHQIRCHLAWLGFPVLNDPVYGAKKPDGYLALCADALRFNDPGTGEEVVFRLSFL